MAPLRLRHPQGVSSIEVDLENGTVLDLQQAILAATSILPSQQELKVGYPPRPLVLIPELPVSSLGIQRGDQIIVAQNSEAPTKTTTAARPASSKPVPNISGNNISLIGVNNYDGNNPAVPRPAHAPHRKVPKPEPARNVPSGSGTSGGTAATRVEAPAEDISEAEQIETPQGWLVHRVVPDDNSCLFSSIGIVLEQQMGAGASQKLRELVANKIRSNPATYPDVVLGRPVDEYIATITKPNTWGGAIELSVFSDHYETEISSIDVETGRIDRFGEGKYGTRVILLYSGIHYDAVSLAPVPPSECPLDFHTTIFPIDGGSAEDDATLKAASQLATQLRKKKKFTNTATFDLKCEICKQGLKGEGEARKHAAATGHTAFGEY